MAGKLEYITTVPHQVICRSEHFIECMIDTAHGYINIMICLHLLTCSIRDLFDHQADCTEEELHLLKHGRHFRLNPETKLIVGRTEGDNQNIINYHNPAADTVIDVKDYPSPIALVPHGAQKESIQLAAAICVGYSKTPKLSAVDVVIKTPKVKKTIQVIAILPEDVSRMLI